MSLVKKIDQDLTEALKSKDEAKLAVLRLVKAAITNVEKQAGNPPAGAPTDDDVINVIQKEIKQRQDTLSQLGQSRPELVEKNQQAIEILKPYLPAQLSAQELETIISQAIQAAGATSLQEIGKVMGQVMPQVKGRADAKSVSQLVRQKLS